MTRIAELAARGVESVGVALANVAVHKNAHTFSARSMGERARRIGVFQRAVALVGGRLMADGLGVALRTVQSYTGVERGLSDATLIGAAAVLEKRAEAMLEQARALRGLVE